MDFNLNFNMPENKGEYKIKSMNSNELYDILILGGGPAALTAAVYCMRKGVKTGLITDNVGGQVAETASVENYMGFKYIEGMSLVEKFEEQVKQFEIGFLEKFPAIKIEGDQEKIVTVKGGRQFKSKAVIVATGKSPRWLNVPGEEKFKGNGIAVCATCDAPLYKDKKVIVVGGGNSGVEAAIDLARVAKHVTIIQFMEDFTADKSLIDNLKTYDNWDVYFNSQVTEISGDKRIEQVDIENRTTKDHKLIGTDGLFVEIGWIPNTDFLKDTLTLNEWNEIIVDCQCKTNVSGIFAAGDVTSVPYKQIIIAAGEGSKAALAAYEYILKN